MSDIHFNYIRNDTNWYFRGSIFTNFYKFLWEPPRTLWSEVFILKHIFSTHLDILEENYAPLRDARVSFDRNVFFWNILDNKGNRYTCIKRWLYRYSVSQITWLFFLVFLIHTIYFELLVWSSLYSRTPNFLLEHFLT